MLGIEKQNNGEQDRPALLPRDILALGVCKLI